MLRRKKIINHLNEHIKVIKQELPDFDIFGCFLYNEPSYGVDIEENGITSYVVVVPPPDIVVRFDEGVYEGRAYKYSSDTIITIDYRKFYSHAWIGTPKILELFCSPYYVINKKYKDDFAELKKYTPALISYNREYLILSYEDYIESCGYRVFDVDKKDYNSYMLATAYRYSRTVTKLLNGEYTPDNFMLFDRDLDYYFYIAIKKHKISYDAAKALSENMIKTYAEQRERIEDVRMDATAAKGLLAIQKKLNEIEVSIFLKSIKRNF
jgi:hypothetical protein